MKNCKYCGSKMIKAHPNKKFCSQKHKDRYHNERNPRGIFSHLHPDNINLEDEEHPFSSEGHGQY